MPLSYDISAAVVLLPPVRGRLGDRRLLRWLSQAQLEKVRAPENLLAQVLGAIGREQPIEGLAALRMWGQTGDRPGTWIAAADPVYMEPRLDRLRARRDSEPPRCAQQDDVHDIVDRWVCELSAKQREVVERRFGLHGYHRETLEHIGEEIGVTRERVRQIQLEALGNLRTMLESNGISGDTIFD